MPLIDARLDALIAALDALGDRPLIPCLDGIDLNPGYHVTELQAAQIQSIDCGGRRRTLSQTRVQLLDGPSGADQYMTATKFAAILDRSRKAIPALAEAPIVFEGAAGNEGLSLFRVNRLDTRPSARLHLTPDGAQCRPRAEGCCNRGAQPQACCAA